MKKLCTGFWVIAMLLSLTACSGKGEAEKVTKKEITEETKKELSVAYQSYSKGDVDDGEVSVTYPVVTISGAEEVAQKIQDDLDKIYKDVKVQKEVLSTITVKRTRLDDNVLSFKSMQNSYLMTVSSMQSSFITWSTGINYDVKTGRRLTLADVVSDKEAFFSFLKKYLKEKMENSQITDEYYDKHIDNMWCFGKEGMTFFVIPNTDAISTPISVTIPYEELSFLKEEYTYNGPYCRKVSFGEEVQADIDGDKKADTIKMHVPHPDEEDSTIEFVINGTDFSSVFEEIPYVVCSPYNEFYIMDIDKNDDTMEILYQDNGMSDDPVAAVFRYENGKVTCLGTVGDTTYGNLDTDGQGKVYVHERMQILETVTIAKEYTIEKGALTLLEKELYEMEGSGEKTIKKKLTVYQNRDASGESVVIKKGSKVSFTGTDDKEWIRLRYGDNEYYVHIVDYIYVEMNGKKTYASEVFTNLIQVG